MENDTTVNVRPNTEGSIASWTLTFSAEERQVLLMALGELLDSVRRDEHLVPTIRTLIKRVRDTQAQ